MASRDRHQTQPRRARGRTSSYDEVQTHTVRGRTPSEDRSGRAHGFRLVFILLGIAFAVVAGRLIFLQVIDGPTLSAAAEARRTNVMTIGAKRGTIYDRNGNILAMSVDCKTIYCNPREVTDVSATAKLLAAELGGQESDYTSKLSSNTTFVYIKKKVDTSVATQLKTDLSASGLKGIYLLSDMKRVYPYGQVAAQVIGVVGSEGQGLTGLELYYNDQLSGTDGSMILETGSDGTPIAGGASETTDAVDGQDLVLAIDVDVQRAAEDSITAGVSNYKAESGSVVVCDPTTGEIIACCSTPLLDPNNSSTMTNDSLTLKPVVASYELGSVFKILTMSIGIENGVINTNSVFTVPAKVQVGSGLVGDDDNRDYTMDMTVREIMRRSSNAGAVMVGEAIGSKLFSEGISGFDIGQKTGIDYPGESAGLVTSLSNYTGATLGSMSFGQGLAVTQIQLVKAISSVANSGTLVTPHFAVQVGKEKLSWPSVGTSCSASTAAAVTDMMRTVVTEGTGTAAQVEGYDIAGKTGTGEIAKTDGTGYRSDAYMSSFVGFTPSTGQKVLTYVGLYATPYLAYQSACPIFSAIMGEALRDLGVSV